jgi:A/G-specific adenine glycosylase
MLQQTRVEAVIPYYMKFLRRFPNVSSLARAKPESVLKLWAGLGYYSRARNLHRAAKEIVARHGGNFPRERDEARKLAGVGDYSAAAVLSIAYDEPLAVLDGNVARVLARLGAIRGDVREPRRWRELGDAALKLLAQRRPGDWNQAMMELGATVCTPRPPHCENCPVAQFCRARALGIADKLPAKRVKRATERVAIAAAVMIDPEGRTLLVRGEHADTKTTALFSNMWQFPAVLAKEGASVGFAGQIRKQFELTHNSRKIQVSELATLRHTVTFREITLVPFLIRVARLPVTGDPETAILLLENLNQLAVSSATRKIADAVARHLKR